MEKWKPQEPTAEIKYFSCRGYKIAYAYYGKSDSKKTILFLYGFGGNIEMVSLIAEKYLSSGYSVLTVDYPGHCFSSDEIKFEIEDFTNILVDLLAFLKENNLYLIGYSLGGMVALSLYKSQKIKIDRLILLHSAASFSYSFFKKIFYRFLGFSLKLSFKFTVSTVAMRVLRDKYFTKELLTLAREVETHNKPESVVEYFEDIIFKDYTDILKDIEIPVLIIASKLDPLATVRACKATQKNIKDSKIIILDDVGHLSVVTRPDIISKLVYDFAYSD